MEREGKSVDGRTMPASNITSRLKKHPKHWQGRRFASTDNLTILLYVAAFHFISDIFFALCLFLSIEFNFFETTPVPQVNIAFIRSTDTYHHHHIRSF